MVLMMHSFYCDGLIGFKMEFLLQNILSPISRRIYKFWSINQNFNNLKRKLDELNNKLEDIDSALHIELHPRKRRKKEVEQWQKDVRKINIEVETIEQIIKRGLFLSRFCLGNIVVEKLEEVKELYWKGSTFGNLVIDEPLANRQILPMKVSEGEITAGRKFEEIWASLINDSVVMIGIYGMGGVGKTTLATHIYNRVSREKKFGLRHVYFITVSHNSRVYKLQDNIAKALHLDLSVANEEKIRAAILYEALATQKFVLILDDVWEPFLLEDVGIPICEKSCKVILTTRLLDVCRRMGCGKTFKVEPLPEEDAQKLFYAKLGHNFVFPTEVEEIVKSVAKECAGLPLAIITIAGSMRGIDNICEWRCALERLQESRKGYNGEEVIFEKLKFSFDRLKDEKVQNCLLYCALYPEDYEIPRHELIEYFIVEGLVEGKNRQAQFDNGHTILNKLESACLLERVVKDFGGMRCVKMHDVVRDMALQITRVFPRFIVQAGVKLRDMPDHEWWTKDLERVSLMKNRIIEIAPSLSPECKRLSTLLLQGNYFYRSIPDNFFLHMTGLRVLDLSDTAIGCLPASLLELKYLTALLLRRCKHLRYVPLLAKLTALRKLDLCDSGIREAPQGMGMLGNLRFLNLWAQNLQKLSMGILPRLSQLEYLVVYNPPNNSNARVEEILTLRKLETLVCNFDDWADYNACVRYLDELGIKDYAIRLGEHFLDVMNMHEESFNRKVILNGRSFRGQIIELLLPKNIQKLKIQYFDDANNMWDIFFSPSLGIDVEEWSQVTGSLEKLILFSMGSLKTLLRGEGPSALATFSFLKHLYILSCPKIKKLFPSGMLLHLPNLEKFVAYNCQQMEETFAEDEKETMDECDSNYDENDGMIYTLPRLKHLELTNLPELKSISPGLIRCDSLEAIAIILCPKLERLPLHCPWSSPPPCLKQIIIDSMDRWDALQWDDLTLKSILQPFLNIKTY
ncbi:Leucine-rich repeat [Dillenia turbinata]|uniref:Leucine-rich repeat n=1 Tax=Dillenia turbinata TaxID=194707 RepID=A0AAN8W6C4_9MAGN